MEENIRQIVYKLSNGAFTPQREDEIIEELSRRNITSEPQIKAEMIKMEKLPRVKTSKIETKGHDYKQEEMQKEELPYEVLEIMRRARTGKAVCYFEIEAKNAARLGEHSTVDPNGGRVLMIGTKDTSISSGYKYSGMQNGRIVLEEDENVGQYVGNKDKAPNKQGQLIEPFRLQAPVVIECEDEHFHFETRVEDNPELSMGEINRYKEELIKAIEESSQALEVVLNEDISKEDKIAKIQQINDLCNKNTTKIAKQNDIAGNTDKMVDRAVDKNTEELQEKVEEEDEYDERGRLIPPRTYNKILKREDGFKWKGKNFI